MILVPPTACFFLFIVAHSASYGNMAHRWKIAARKNALEGFGEAICANFSVLLPQKLKNSLHWRVKCVMIQAAHYLSIKDLYHDTRRISP